MILRVSFPNFKFSLLESSLYKRQVSKSSEHLNDKSLCNGVGQSDQFQDNDETEPKFNWQV